jgi:hypothetical protein
MNFDEFMTAVDAAPVRVAPKQTPLPLKKPTPAWIKVKPSHLMLLDFSVGFDALA